METQEIINLLNDSSNEVSRFATKKWHVIDSQTAKDKYCQNNSIKFQTESIKALWLLSDAFILVTGDVAVIAENDIMLHLKILHHFLHAKQKLMMYLSMKQIIFTLQCLSTTWLNIVIIIQIH